LSEVHLPDVSRCRGALAGFSGKRILIVGDMMLDEHIWGNVERISPEAPVMVVNVESPEPDCRPGGAANVATNVRALGAEVYVVGVIGDDEGGAILRDCLVGAGVNVDGLVVDKSRPTTRKTRIWSSHRYQVVRVDRESKKTITPSIVKRITGGIREIAEHSDAIHIHHLAGIGAITLNNFEACAASGLEIHGDADVEKAARKILTLARCGGIVITRGAHGLCACDGKSLAHIPPVDIEVYDGTGAGDAVISSLTLALATGLALIDAAYLANLAGASVVRKVGVVTTSVAEIGSLLDSLQTK